MPSILSNYFTRAELAKELGRTIRTLERWEAARTGPPITRLGKQPLYRRQAVQDWLLHQERHPPPPPSGRVTGRMQMRRGGSNER
jgi:hypothetical protein